jgi:hypothetical protein
MGLVWIIGILIVVVLVISFGHDRIRRWVGYRCVSVDCHSAGAEFQSRADVARADGMVPGELGSEALPLSPARRL